MNKEPTPNADPIIHCHECKHLEVINSKNVYAVCMKTNYVFKSFQIDTRQHSCAFGEGIQNITCKDCIRYVVCKEVDRLQQRYDFAWYKAEKGGCPYYRDISPSWISVDNQLPPPKISVLVTTRFVPENLPGWPCVAELRNGTWWSNASDFSLEETGVQVTHWMPLPDPPNK